MDVSLEVQVWQDIRFQIMVSILVLVDEYVEEIKKIYHPHVCGELKNRVPIASL